MTDNQAESSASLPRIKKAQLVLAFIVTLGGSAVCLSWNSPFHPGFGWVALTSALFHLTLLLLFNRLSNKILVLSNFFNLVLLGFAIHFTGGILSPFVGVFILILFSGAGYGVPYKVVLLSSLGIYLLVVCASAFGLVESHHISTAAIYAHWPTAVLIIFANVGFMISSGSIYEMTIERLKAGLLKEQRLKDSLLREYSKLEAPSQIGLLVNKIAHDFRGPIGAISGFISLFKQENNLSQESQEDCDMILSELERINKLLGRLTTYSKTGSAAVERLDLAALIKTVVSVIRFMPQAKKVKITKRYPPGENLTVLGVKDEIHQILFNLLKNSVEAVTENPGSQSISVTLEEKDGQALVKVKDNGPGIPADKIPILAREGHTTKKDGRGLGLIIVREILEKNHGKLLIDSIVGQGATMTMVLPMK